MHVQHHDMQLMPKHMLKLEPDYNSYFHSCYSSTSLRLRRHYHGRWRNVHLPGMVPFVLFSMWVLFSIRLPLP